MPHMLFVFLFIPPATGAEGARGRSRPAAYVSDTLLVSRVMRTNLPVAGESLMRKLLPFRCVLSLPLLVAAANISSSSKAELPKLDADGFITIFNGKDLTGWEGLEEFWTVKDGVISGHETKRTSKQTFLIWTGGKPDDFELHLKYKFATPDGNSGI